MLYPIYHLYLLQLESYEIKRYLRLLKLKGIIPPQELRQHIVWTSKAKLLFVVSTCVWILSSASIGTQLNAWLGTIFAILNFFLFPLWLILVALIFYPLDSYLKLKTKEQGRLALASSGARAVIAIVGSYGKTTMKQVLLNTLSSPGGVFATPDSVNAPVGVARWLKKTAQKDAILIVEMGEHYKGDIAELCRLAPPDIVLLTGMTEAHLERFETFENLKATLLEALEHKKPNAPIIANGDDVRLRDSLQNREGVSFYGAAPESNARYAKNIFDPRSLGWHTDIEIYGKKMENIFVPLIGDYAPSIAAAVGEVLRALGLEMESVRAALATIKPVPHRLEPIQSGGGVLVIDDSYNGNPEGAKRAMRALSQFPGRRHIYLTPGLVEMGEASRRVHLELGRELKEHADLVLIIETSVSKWIRQGLLEAGFRESSIRSYKTAQAAHADLPNVLKENDVIVFQNDWGDQYV